MRSWHNQNENESRHCTKDDGEMNQGTCFYHFEFFSFNLSYQCHVGNHRPYIQVCIKETSQIGRLSMLLNLDVYTMKRHVVHFCPLQNEFLKRKAESSINHIIWLVAYQIKEKVVALKRTPRSEYSFSILTMKALFEKYDLNKQYRPFYPEEPFVSQSESFL